MYVCVYAQINVMNAVPCRRAGYREYVQISIYLYSWGEGFGILGAMYAGLRTANTANN